MVASPTLAPARSRPGRIYDIEIGGAPVGVTISELPDGQPAQVFISAGKHGSTFAGMCDTIATVVSVALQHQVPLAEIVRRLAGMRFEPAGLTSDPDIPAVTSLSDYLARRLACDYLGPDERAAIGVQPR